MLASGSSVFTLPTPPAPVTMPPKRELIALMINAKDRAEAAGAWRGVPCKTVVMSRCHFSAHSRLCAALAPAAAMAHAACIANVLETSSAAGAPRGVPCEPLSILQRSLTLRRARPRSHGARRLHRQRPGDDFDRVVERCARCVWVERDLPVWAVAQPSTHTWPARPAARARLQILRLPRPLRASPRRPPCLPSASLPASRRTRVPRPSCRGRST